MFPPHSATEASRHLTGRDMQRPCVLVIAFACCPPHGKRFSGGEDVLGWNLVKQISRFCETWVLTHAKNRQDIEDALRDEAHHAVHFEYVSLPAWLWPLEHLQGALQLYAYLWQLKAYFTAKRLLHQHRFALAHQLTYANDWMASFIGALLPIPYLRGPAGGAHRVPLELLSEFTMVGRMSEHLRSLMQWILRRDPFFRRGHERAMKLLVCNQEAMEALPSVWRQKALLFPVNGISEEDLALLERSPIPQRAEGFRVLSAGKLIRLKGFGLGMKAFKRLSDRHPDARLEIIGDGPDRRYLKSAIKSMGLEDTVTLTPWKARDQFLVALRRCDVFLFPSLRDGGGAVVVEAMAAGKPVVCFDLGGPAVHVTDACGMKVNPRHPSQAINDLAEALETLYRQSELRAQLGAAARERVLSHYHWDRLGERLREIYSEVLTQRGNRDEMSQAAILLETSAHA